MKNKPNLPTVSEQTIIEVGNEAIADKDTLFMEMATANPMLYLLIFNTFNMESCTKETMLGVCIASYITLDREMGKAKQLRKRVRRDNGKSV